MRALSGLIFLVFGTLRLLAAQTERPNILWISCEDTSPWLGFCGEKYATTPNLDRLAREGVYFRNAFASAPVCSPCRFGIITGVYATCEGTQRLRSQFPVPDSIKSFPAYLRAAGYYCANNVKTDYNTSAARRFTREAWDDCSANAHWRNRKPGQPFFAVFNLTETHQSKAFETAHGPDLDPAQKHDPAKAPVPPYFPDTAGARRTIARVHDCITAMDKHAGQILAELERDGLKDNTIVFFWADHGQGIPRGKRTLWDTGLQVPLVVSFPAALQHLSPERSGSASQRMVSLLDLGPTVLSLLELPVPAFMEGVPFLGKSAAPPRSFVYGARDRVDEALELSRSVRDERYLYIRNYMPHLSWLQPESFSDQLEFRRELASLAASNRLNSAQMTLCGPDKPVEALYDTLNDRWQITNVVAQPEMRPALEKLRAALVTWQTEHRDLGFIHEWEAARLCSTGTPLSEVAGRDNVYAYKRVLDTAGRVGRVGEVNEFISRLADSDPTVRYWAAVGLRAAGPAAAPATNALRTALADLSLPVRIEAAGVLASLIKDQKSLDCLASLASGDDVLARQHAARTLELLRPAVPGSQPKAKSPRPKKAGRRKAPF